jgi:uncharacterized protein
MKIVITGGTGFIGSRLVQILTKTPHEIVLFTRTPSRIEIINSVSIRHIHWDAETFGAWTEEINGSDIVINLVGKNLFEERWNARVKNELVHTRIHPTELIVETIQQAVAKPSLLISASAVGYYGDRGDERLTEDSSNGNDFLSGLVTQWERTARSAEKFGVRVATPRIGIVLQREGGILKKLKLPFKLFSGGWIGSGNQFFPWIHMTDVIRSIVFPIDHEEFSGPYNVTAPVPLRMKEFCTVLGKVLRRPSWIPVPNIALKILFGEGGNAILSGQYAVPEKLLSSGFHFTYNDVSDALQDIFPRQKPSEQPKYNDS